MTALCIFNHVSSTVDKCREGSPPLTQIWLAVPPKTMMTTWKNVFSLDPLTRVQTGELGSCESPVTPEMHLETGSSH